MDVTIRNIDNDVVAKLNSIAKKKKISREKLLRTILTNAALSGEVKDVEEKYEGLVKMLAAAIENNSRVIEKNTQMIDDVMFR